MDLKSSDADNSLPNEGTRLALYGSVNDTIRSFRTQQWTLVALVLALLFGIGKLARDNPRLAHDTLRKCALTAALALIVVMGTTHLWRLHSFIATQKRVRLLLERSFGFHEWKQLTDLFKLLGQKKLSVFGDWFELAMWSVAFILFTIVSSYFIWTA